MLDKLDLIVEIEELLDESEFFPYGHPDGNYHWELITAPYIENSKFTVEFFLIWLEFIESTTWEDFLLNFELDITSYEYDYPELVEEYQNTLDFIQENLQNIQVYKMRLEGINEETEEDCLVNNLYCIIGQFKENYWLGIVPDFFDSEQGGASSKQFVITTSEESNEIASYFRAEFKSRFKNFSDIFTRPLTELCNEGYKIEVVEDRDLIIEKLFSSGCYCWNTEFRENLIDSKLAQLITNNLLDVRQYNVCGHDGLFIYVGGKTEDSYWIGLYTRQEYVY